MRIEETSGKHRALRVDFVSLARGYRFVQTPSWHQRLAILASRFLASGDIR